jgi:hypothetical protein
VTDQFALSLERTSEFAEQMPDPEDVLARGQNTREFATIRLQPQSSATFAHLP